MHDYSALLYEFEAVKASDMTSCRNDAIAQIKMTLNDMRSMYIDIIFIGVEAHVHVCRHN